MPDNVTLSRRERQIMDILYRLGSATAAEVQENLAEAPSYSAVRALLRILEEKGHLKHAYDGPRYVCTRRVASSRAEVRVEADRENVLRRIYVKRGSCAAGHVGERPVGKRARPAGEDG